MQDLQAIYTFNPQTNETELMACISPAPPTLKSYMILEYFQFKKIGGFEVIKNCKELSIIVDAVSIIHSKK